MITLYWMAWLHRVSQLVELVIVCVMLSVASVAMWIYHKRRNKR